MKRRILLIAREFDSADPYAERATKFAKYLTRAGYEVTVLTGEERGRQAGSAHDARYGRVLRARRARALSVFAHLLHRPLSAKKGVRRPSSYLRMSELPLPDRSFSSALAWFLCHRRTLHQEREFYRAILDYVQHAGLDLSQFDVMVSVASPFSAHQVALALKAKCPSLHWIADYRDHVDLTHRYYRKWQKRVLLHCDAVTAASEGILKQVRGKTKLLRSRVIYNGFDPEDLFTLREVPCEEGRPFTVLISGAVTPGEEDPVILFETISDILKEGRIRRDQICVDFYGPASSGEYLESKLAEMEFPPIFRNMGHAPRSVVNGAMRGAQMLFLSNFEEATRRGRIPIRFSEYLMLQKPIFASVRTLYPGTELSRIIQSLRIGCCLETGGGAASYEAVKKYVSESYTYWRTRGKELYEPDERRLRALDYQNLIRDVREIIEEC